MDERRYLLTVLKAQSGDRQALDDLFRSVQATLYRCIRQIVGHRETAEDVLQNVFVILQKQLIHLREPEHFNAWCYRIASREAIRQSRNDRKRTERNSAIEPDHLPSAPVIDAMDGQIVDRLAEMVDAVPLASRTVLVLHYSESLTLPEVAGILGIPLGTAKSRLAYGLEVLRKLLRDESKT